MMRLQRNSCRPFDGRCKCRESSGGQVARRMCMVFVPTHPAADAFDGAGDRPVAMAFSTARSVPWIKECQ